MNDENKRTTVDVTVELDLERLAKTIADKTSKIIADKISESMLTEKTDWNSFPLACRPVLILDGGIALELDDSFEEAKAKLRQDGTLHGCKIVGE